MFETIYINQIFFYEIFFLIYTDYKTYTLQT